MKKLLLGLILFTIVILGMKKNIYASSVDSSLVTKPLVCLEGIDYSYLLEYEGYTIINKLVDFFNRGTYYVTYINDLTKETLTKRIDVITKEQVDDIYYCHDNKQLLTSKTRLIDYKSFQNAIYYLETEIIDDENYIYLSKVVNDKIEFTKLIKQDRNCFFNNLLIDHEGIYLSGYIYVNGYGVDIYLMKLDMSGNIICENTIGGTGIDRVEAALLNGKYIYLSGYTTSNGGYFEGIRNKEDSFVIKVNKEFLHPELAKTHTLSFNNTIKWITVVENDICLLEEYSNGSNVLYKIKRYTQNFDLVYESQIINSYTLSPKKLLSNRDDIYLIAYQYNYMINKYSNRVYKIDDLGNLGIFYEYTNYDEDNTRIIDMAFINDTTNILMYDPTNFSTKLFIKEIDVTINVDNASEPLGLNKTNNLSFVNKDKSITTCLYIKTNPKLLINNFNISLSNKSKINLNNNYFGRYHDIYVYETKEVIYSLYENKYIEPEVSINSNETYDINTKLKFNGKGTLNGVDIESGYIVDKEGEYILEILGTNNEKQKYSFSIKRLSSKETSKNTSNSIVTTNVNYTNNVQNDLLHISPDINDETKSIYMFGLLLIPLILVILSIFLVFWRKYEK